MMVFRNFVAFLIFFCTGLAPAYSQEPFRGELSLAALQAIPLLKESGKKTALRFSATPLKLFVLLSPDCPMCKNYTLALNNLHKKYGHAVQVFGIVPGRAYAAKEVRRFAKAYHLPFPVLTDPDKELSLYLGATVTPEVILADSTGFVVYRGAIDDWVQELGKKKIAPQELYLEQAVQRYLQGQPVLVKSTIPQGCLINEF